MAEVATNHSIHEAVGSGKDPNQSDPSTTLFHRRIEFHLARKPFTGFSEGGDNSGFKLETLNPNSNSNYSSKSSESHRALSGCSKSSEENNSGGLDPELSFRISFRRIGAGLQNLGNTCFLNSVLQCLTYTEPLAAYLQSGRHKTSCRTAGFCALCAIQKHVSRALESTGRILAPKDLVSNLRCISRNFRNARQEDAHEYMVNLLESMHKCCLPSGVPTESPGAYEKSLVHKIFGGRLRSQVKCMQCSFCSNKFDPFLDLSLEIVKADSLYKALVHFTAKEQLDGGERQYQCQQCKQKVRALKQLTVYNPPQVLTIHLKRFGSHMTGQKIDKKIQFGPTLDLKPFVTGTCDGDLKYTLYGVLVHAGWSTHSGHYYCFVRTSSGMWYSLDDNQVVQVSERKVLEQKAYMLFYVRDRRNSATKKTVDVVQTERMVINALGNKAYNNFNPGLKETIKNESIEKNLNDSFSAAVAAVAQRDALNANLLKESQIKMDSGLKVNGPVADECLSQKKVQPMENLTPKIDLVNGKSNSNLAGGDCLQSASSFKSSPPADSGNKGLSAERDLTAPVDVQHNCNNPKTSVEKNKIDTVVVPSNCNGDASAGKDLTNIVDEPSNSNILNRSSGEMISILHETKHEEVGGFSGMAGVPDSACQNVHDSGQGESKPTQPGLLCKKSLDHKLHIVKRRSFKCQVTRMHLSSNIILGATLGRKKKKHRKRRQESLGKLDGKSVLADLGPSTSETSKIVTNGCVGFSPRRVKCDSDKKDSILPTKNLSENAELQKGVISAELRERIDRDDSVPSTEMQSHKSSCTITTEKLSDFREVSFLKPSRKDHVENGSMSVLARGLEETTVAQWDGVELPSELIDSRSAGIASIGYIGDEWDEEYDRGKRKKIRNSKLNFGGPNPFQEVAVKKSKMKKAKLNHFTSANQPFRILSGS